MYLRADFLRFFRARRSTVQFWRSIGSVMSYFRASSVLGSARALACWFRRLAETNLARTGGPQFPQKKKVRDDEGGIASTRGACAPQMRGSRDDCYTSKGYIQATSFV
jgi:hypothetical protein